MKTKGINLIDERAMKNGIVVERHPGGRPTDYRPEYCEQAYRLCVLGLKDAELAEFFEVTEQTINNWKEAHPEFLESLKKGKTIADEEVAVKLRDRALGYEHPEDKIFLGPGGVPVIVPTIKHYPPDPTSAIFWLKNRQPGKWRDKIEHTGEGGGPISVKIVRFSDRKLEGGDKR